MRRAFLALTVAAAALAQQPDETLVFRSEVSLVRVDVRVTGPDRRSIPGLAAQDFELFDNGRPQPIRSFAAEGMPLDLLFLIDVSVSMRPHVARIARASRSALRTLSPGDRGAIMVFDRQSRLRLGWNDSLETVAAGLDAVVDEERFNGGTDITRALLDAARYVKSSARRDARRAIVILTDDQTERDRNEQRVLRALEDADTVLSALIAPDALGTGRASRRPGWGDIIFGPRYPGRYPSPQRSRTQSAGTPEIARESGGESLPVEHASALQETLENLRQRYSLFFSVPADARVGQRRTIHVALSRDAARRHPGAQLAYRSQYLVPADWTPPPSDAVSSSNAPTSSAASSSSPDSRETAAADPAPPPPPPSRRPVTGESYGTRGPDPRLGVPAPNDPVPAAGAPAKPSGGWREATSADYEEAKRAEEPKRSRRQAP